MDKLCRFRFGLAALGFILSLVFACGTATQASAVTDLDPHNLDISGVKLGMTVDQTVAAIEKANPSYVITKLYWASEINKFGVTGYPIESVSASNTGAGELLSNNFAFLTGLVAENGEPDCADSLNFPTQNPSNSYNLPCSTPLRTPFDIIEVWFSPTLGQENVIAIKRDDCFNTGSPSVKFPSLAATKNAIFAKYSASPSVIDSNGEEFDWFFDGRGRFISSNRVQELQNSGQRAPAELGATLPQSVSPGDGITLSVMVTPASDTSDGLGDIQSSLVDSDALYNSIAQGEATYDAQRAKMDGQAPKNGAAPGL